MKVLHISSFFTETPPKKYGGTERLVHYLCDELSLLGVKTHLIRLTGSMGGNYISTNVGVKKLSQKVRDVIQKERPDIIHLHSRQSKVIDFLSTQKIPVVVTLYNNIRKKNSWVKLLKHPPSNFRFAAISSSLAERASQLAGTRRRDIFVLPPCYNLSLYRSRNDYKKEYFVYLGIIARYKSVLDITKSFVGSKEKLLIVGPCNNPKEKPYFNEVLSYTKHKNIKYYGETKNDKEKINILLKAKALIIATGLDKEEKNCHEAFGLVMLEANALGIPVIGYRRGNIANYIFENKNGILFSNTKQLKNAIERVQQKNWRSGCIKISKKFDSKKVVRLYADLYRRIISGNKF